MLSPFITPLLAMALLTVSPPPSAPSPCGQERRRIELLPDTPQEVPEVCISAQLATTLLFDLPLQPGAVELESEDQFTAVEASGRLLTLIPSSELTVGRRLRLSVRFMAGEPPVAATFVLVVHPIQAARQVEVFRRKASVQDCQRESAKTLERIGQLQAEIQRLHRRCGQWNHLVDKILPEMLNHGVVVVQTAPGSSMVPSKGEEFSIQRLTIYHGTRPSSSPKTPLAFQVELPPRPDDSPWHITWATVTTGTHEAVLHVWQAYGPTDNTLHVLLDGSLELTPHTTYYSLKLQPEGDSPVYSKDITLL